MKSTLNTFSALVGQVMARARRLSTGLIVSVLLTAGASAPALAQVMNFTSASPSTFSAAGQVITFNLTFDQSNAVVQTLAVNLNYPGSALSCPGLPLQPGGSVNCTVTYTTQAIDVGNPITQFGTFSGTTASNVPFGGAISNQQVVPFVPPPSVSIAVSPASINEDAAGTLNYTITLDQASANAISVNLTMSGTATTLVDYTGATTALTIPAGVTSGVVTIDPTADATPEANETVRMTVAAGTGYTVGAPASATATITNDDVPSASIAVSPASVSEDGAPNLVYTVTLSPAPLVATAVNFTVGGTATSGTDYAAITSPLTIAAGATTGTVVINPTADATIEADETATLTLAAGTGYTVGAPATATGTILNDDLPTLTINDVTLSEGNAGTTNATFTVSLSAPAGPGGVAFDLATANGTATAGVDYVANALTGQMIPAGSSTYTFTVLLNGDALNEPSETFFVNVTNVTNAIVGDGQGVGTIVNDDPLPSLSINSVTANEGNAGTTSFTFSVALSVASGRTVTVNYATADGSASSGSDYAANSGTLTFTPGVTVQTVTVLVAGDTTAEPTETFTVGLSGATNATITTTTGTGTITNDDTPALSISDVGLAEGNAGNTAYTFTISLSQPAPAGGVSFTVATADNSASAGTDYTAASSALTIPAGSSSTTFTVQGTGDIVFEPNETFFVNVTGVTGATVADGQGQGIIINDEATPTLAIDSVSSNEGDAGQTAFTFTVTMTPSSQVATVNYASANGSATAGADYTAISGTLTFAPGDTSKTVTVQVAGDNLVEANETFTVTLSGALGAVLVTPTGTGTIVNDDVAVSVNPATVPGTTVGAAYSQALSATGGQGPYTYALTAGALPAGISLSAAGTISGTATAGGTFNFTVTASDSVGAPGPNTGSRAYSITVAAATITLPPTTLAQGTRAVAYSATLNAASGGTAPYSYAVTAGALPGGVSLNAAGQLGGTPTVFGTFNFSVTATDSSTGSGPYSAAQSYSLVIVDSAPIATASSATVAYGSSNNPIPLSLSGGAATSVSLAGGPAHGTATVTGTSISYTPAADFAGQDAFFYAASNSGGSSAVTRVDITVTNPTITVAASGSLAATVGVPYSQTFTWSGGTAPYDTYNVGSLPSGLTITGTTANSVTVSGTPTQAGSFATTASARDSSTGDGPFTTAQVFTLTVAAPTLVLAPASGTFTLAYAAPYSQTFTASGGVGPYNYGRTGTLPAGVSFANGTLSGTPTAPGSYPITIIATDFGSSGAGAPFTVSNTYTLTVTAPTIVFTPATLPGTTAGAAYAQTIAASGAVAPYAYTVTAGALPAGISLSNAGALAGTATTAGTFNFTVTATDANGQLATRAYSVVVAVPTLAITPATIPGATANSAYSQTLSASGGVAPYSYAVTAGALPAGLSLSSAGLLSGTPTVSGTFNFTVTVTDSTGGTAATATRAYSLVVAVPTLTLSPATLPIGQQQQAYAATFVAAGGIAPYQYALASGSLPPGLALNATGTLGGIPTANGTYTFSITATDSTGGTPATVTRSFTVIISLRPDPSKDAEVLGLLDAQAATTRRFAAAQLGNFRQHLESLHDGTGGTGARGASGSLGFSGADGFDPRRDCDSASSLTVIDNTLDCTRTDRNGLALNAGAEGTTANSNSNAPLVNLWVGGVLRQGERDARIGREGFDFESDGISIGADYRTSESFAIGAGIGIGRDRTDVGSHGSRVDGDATTAAIYGSYHPGDTFYVDGLAGYQWLSYDLTRFVTHTGGQVTGSRDGKQWLASLAIGGDFRDGAMQISPYARWDYAHATLDGYTEQGDAIWALRFAEQRVRTSTINLGVRLQNRYEMTWGAFSPQFRLEYQHDLQDNEDAVLSYADTLSGPFYRALLLATDKSRIELGLGGVFELRDEWALRLEYRRQQSETDDSDALQLNVEKKF